MTTGESELDTRGTEHRVVWIRLVRRDVSVATIGLLLLLVSTALVQNPPAGWETSIFHSINDLPRQAKWLVWPLQQAGMALAVPAGAAVLWMVVRHLRPPVALITGGIVFGWAGAKLIKEVVQRGRPGALLEDVNYGFATHIEGLGFPSGHAVVAFTLAWVWAPYLPRPLRWAVYGVAVTVGFSRVYMGAHLPLDVVGGAGYGLLIGAVVNLAAGVLPDRIRLPLPTRRGRGGHMIE